MELLLKLTPPEDVQQHVLPMLYRGLDSDSAQIHELCLSVLPTFAGLLDHANVKNSLLPRIKKLCLSTSTLSVRVNCLLCVGKLLEHLDKWLVLDEVSNFAVGYLIFLKPKKIINFLIKTTEQRKHSRSLNILILLVCKLWFSIFNHVFSL